MKCFVALFMASTKAMGVASPKAQGQEMSKTALACKKAEFKPDLTAQNAKITPAKSKIKLTKYAEILSTSFAIGIFALPALKIKSLISSNLLSIAFFAAFMVSVPLTSKLPASISSPFCLMSGTNSPLKKLISTSALPSTTTPSTLTLSPALTSTISPAFMKDDGVFSKSPLAFCTKDRLVSMLKSEFSL